VGGFLSAPVQGLIDVVRKQTCLYRPRGGASTGVDLLGMSDTVTGTGTARATANTNLFTTTRRIGLVSAAGAGSTGGTRHNNAEYFRSSVAVSGGFRYVARFGVSLLSGGENRFFVGLRVGAGVYGNFEPSTSLDIVCVGADVADTQLQVMHNDGAGAATKVALGASFPWPGTVNQDFYEVEIICPAGASPNITVVVTRIDTPATVTSILSANLPTADTMLSPQVWMNNGATAAAVGIDVIGQLIEAP
jgi:hypothetical protein